MTTNSIPFWEDYNEDHNNFMSDYLDESSVIANMKFNILKNYHFEMSTSIDQNEISSELSFEGSLSLPNCKIKYEGEIKENSIAELELKNDDETILLNVCKKESLTGNIYDNIQTNFRIRTALANLCIGYENFSPFFMNMNAIMAKNFNNFNTFAGVSSCYDFQNNYFSFYKLLIGQKYYEKLSSYIEIVRKRNLVAQSIGDTDDIHTETKLSIISDYNVNDRVKIAGELILERKLESWDYNLAMVAEYQADEKTILKTKIYNFSELFASIRHQISDNVNFCMVSKIEFVPKNEEKFTHFKYNFGVKLEFNEE